MKVQVKHSLNQSQVVFTLGTDRECEIFNHLAFALCSPGGLKKAISDSDTDFSNALTMEDLKPIQTSLNEIWKSKTLKTKVDLG